MSRTAGPGVTGRTTEEIQTEPVLPGGPGLLGRSSHTPGPPQNIGIGPNLQLPPGGVLDLRDCNSESKLLGHGQGTGTPGPFTDISLGLGLVMVANTLSVAAAAVAGAGYWAPVTNGDPVTPELLFDGAGECIVGFVPTP